MSPVEMCGHPNCCRSNRACVPFPEPGGPNSIKQNLLIQSSAARTRPVRPPIRTNNNGEPATDKCSGETPPSANAARPRRESFIVAHDQLGLDLVDRVHRDPDHDQQRRAAEVESHAQTVQQPTRERTCRSSCRPAARCCSLMPEIMICGISDSTARYRPPTTVILVRILFM